jgi:hypothetical protein
MSNEPGSRRISDQVLLVNVTGYLLPWWQNQAVFLEMPDKMNIDKFLPLFTTRGGLVQLMRYIGVPFDQIKKIDDSGEFLDSIPSHAPSGEKIHIIIDPHYVENNRIRYTEILRGEGVD